MEQAKEGVYGATNFARLLITSPEFRDELVEAIGAFVVVCLLVTFCSESGSLTTLRMHYIQA